MSSFFVNGELFDRVVVTPKGRVEILAEVRIDGETLHLRDMTIYGLGAKPLTGLTREMLAAKTRLLMDARTEGFASLRITAERAATSSSAKPGKKIDLTFSLRRR